MSEARRRRSMAVSARGTAAFAVAVLALTGCGDDPENADYQATCHDAQGVRVDDDYCDDDDDDDHHGGSFIFWPMGSHYPAHGQSYSGYRGHSRSVPKGHSAVYGGASKSGGTVSRSDVKTSVSRGGFGKSSVSKGGGGTGG